MKKKNIHICLLFLLNFLKKKSSVCVGGGYEFKLYIYFTPLKYSFFLIQLYSLFYAAFSGAYREIFLGRREGVAEGRGAVGGVGRLEGGGGVDEALNVKRGRK